jgi:hypothetical protein
LCRRLADVRGRPLTLHDADLPALPSGIWYDDGSRDRIIYRATAAGYHRDHIILHEICHLLAGHGRPLPALADGPLGTAGSDLGRAYQGFEEALAEAFASTVLNLAGQLPSPDLSAVERRAEELFGVTRA